MFELGTLLQKLIEVNLNPTFLTFFKIYKNEF